MNELPVLDSRPLLELLEIGAGMEVVQELIGILREDVPTRLALLKAGLEAGNAEQVMMEAHQLKGSLGNLGLKRFAELARLIETEARAQRLDRIPGWLEQLPAAHTEGLEALTMAFPPDAPTS